MQHKLAKLIFDLLSLVKLENMTHYVVYYAKSERIGLRNGVFDEVI